MNEKALYKLSYGVYVITSKKGDRFNGQIANTAIQITSAPITISVSINKNNLTHEFIKASKAFVVSIVAQDAPLSLIGQFGFKSGHDVKNKFEGVNYKLTPNGLPYVTDHTVSYIEVKVLQEVDAGTHTLFIGEPVGGEVLQDSAPMTYAYYHQVKSGRVPKTDPTYVVKQDDKPAADKYVCSICGYTYNPELGDPDGGIAPGTAFADIPEDWVCPVCGASKGDFEKA